jgi:RNA polymerase sigma-70 factor (ECF subfamily)
METGPAPPERPSRSRVDPAVEEAALDCLRRGQHTEALRILMTAYGAPILAFCARFLRDRERAKDVRQQVFLKAFQRFETFEGRGSLWSWLCGIAYRSGLDELKAVKALANSDVLDELSEPSTTEMDADRVAAQRALERCLGKQSPATRAQVLMHYHLGLSHAEIAEVVGDAPGTVQMRLYRALPKLRRCLRGEGVAR